MASKSYYIRYYNIIYIVFSTKVDLGSMKQKQSSRYTFRLTSSPDSISEEHHHHKQSLSFSTASVADYALWTTMIIRAMSIVNHKSQLVKNTKAESKLDCSVQSLDLLGPDSPKSTPDSDCSGWSDDYLRYRSLDTSLCPANDISVYSNNSSLSSGRGSIQAAQDIGSQDCHKSDGPLTRRHCTDAGSIDDGVGGCSPITTKSCPEMPSRDVNFNVTRSKYDDGITASDDVLARQVGNT